MSDTGATELEMLAYFWQEKGDIRRGSSLKSIKEKFPKVYKAWIDLRQAQHDLSVSLGITEPFPRCPYCCPDGRPPCSTCEDCWGSGYDEKVRGEYLNNDPYDH